MDTSQEKTTYEENWSAKWEEILAWFDQQLDKNWSSALYNFDRVNQGLSGWLTQGLSPFSVSTALFDWQFHFLMSPGKRISLLLKAILALTRIQLAASKSLMSSDPSCCFIPNTNDPRFHGEEWEAFPFRLFYQTFLTLEDLWHDATTKVHGVSRHHEEITTFFVRQIMDMLSPSNSIVLNPKVLKKTIEHSGVNLVKGVNNFVQDSLRNSVGLPPPGTEKYIPGKTVAITKGDVVYRNNLIELIQYHPTTKTVHKEPILVIPAWIMKYYILDLRPENSLVKYLVDQGHTVFMISWRNPDNKDRDIGMEDYITKGALEAIQVVNKIVPNQQINAVGYCIGGTLLAIVAAYLAREGMPLLNSITLLAAQVDFTEAGELTLFIDESQVSFLEDMMSIRGYLDSKQMTGTFQFLRSNDLVWSRHINDYLTGERSSMTDLMAWSQDSTRMPFRMHSEYLRHLFLNNDLFEGRYLVNGRPVVLTDIKIPTFTVGTERDHIAPWRSVYKLSLLSDSDFTFVLTSGGHNAGIVSEVGHKGRYYRASTRKMHTKYIDPKTWVEHTPVTEGSWWPLWSTWLFEKSSGQKKPPSIGSQKHHYNPLEPAPGRYVLESRNNSMGSKVEKGRKKGF